MQAGDKVRYIGNSFPLYKGQIFKIVSFFGKDHVKITNGDIELENAGIWKMVILVGVDEIEEVTE